MRQKLTVPIFVACALLLANTGTPAMSHFVESGANSSLAGFPMRTNVTGNGCVRAGIESGCLNFITEDKKNSYSLHFDPKNMPTAETMIHFEGTTMDVDTCMQGTPVKVTKWNALKTKCPAESK